MHAWLSHGWCGQVINMNSVKKKWGELMRETQEVSKLLERFTSELAQSTGVAKEDVKKVLDELGFTDVSQLLRPKQITIEDVRWRIKQAVKQVAL